MSTNYLKNNDYKQLTQVNKQKDYVARFKME